MRIADVHAQHRHHPGTPQPRPGSRGRGAAQWPADQYRRHGHHYYYHHHHPRCPHPLITWEPRVDLFGLKHKRSAWVTSSSIKSFEALSAAPVPDPFCVPWKHKSMDGPMKVDSIPCTESKLVSLSRCLLLSSQLCYPLSIYIAAVASHCCPYLTLDPGAVDNNTVPPTIAQPPNVPALPPSTNITVPTKAPPPGQGSNIPSQNVPGGQTVTSPGAALVRIQALLSCVLKVSHNWELASPSCMASWSMCNDRCGPCDCWPALDWVLAVTQC